MSDTKQLVFEVHESFEGTNVVTLTFPECAVRMTENAFMAAIEAYKDYLKEQN